jgi:acyl-CoA thioesterase I
MMVSLMFNRSGAAPRAALSVTRRECIALGLSLVGALGALTTVPAAAAGTAPAPKVLIVGDSLSAEYGLPRGTGWVALLQARLASSKSGATVVNASISGDTTSGGRSRLPALLKQHRPSHVVIELGGNDALRGLPLKMTEDNLRAMAQASRAQGAKVLVVGMQVPPNYGAAYGRDFAGLFAKVARDEGAALVPFLLEGLADDPDPLRWFQPDRIHPTAAAHPRILDNVWAVMGPWLRK